MCKAIWFQIIFTESPPNRYKMRYETDLMSSSVQEDTFRGKRISQDSKKVSSKAPTTLMGLLGPILTWYASDLEQKIIVKSENVIAMRAGVRIFQKIFCVLEKALLSVFHVFRKRIIRKACCRNVRMCVIRSEKSMSPRQLQTRREFCSAVLPS